MTVTSGGATLLDDDVTRDCDEPDPKVTDEPVYAAGGIGMNLNNLDGADEAVFTVNGVDVVVPAGQTVQHVVTVAEDATVRITVTSGDETLSRPGRHPQLRRADRVDHPLVHGEWARRSPSRTRAATPSI